MKTDNFIKTCAVIVTYGDRHALLSQVIFAVINSGVNEIIIVDNNSSENSQELFNSINNKNIIIVHFENNTGSANGFLAGIREAKNKTDCEFIWLLDDDNKPRYDALNILKKFWSELKHPNKEERVSLISFRKDRQLYLKAIEENNPRIVLGKDNIFRSFHIYNIFQGIYDKVFNNKKKIKNNIKNDYMEMHVGPYGGMFFNRKLIETIGYPNKKYYLYVDDHEYTYRIIKNGGKIYLVLKSIVEDIDQSWSVVSSGFAFSRIAKDTNYVKLYYSIRNRLYFEKTELVNNWIVYLLNLSIYSFFVLCVALINGNLKNIKVYFTAISHGLLGKMGKNNNYILQ